MHETLLTQYLARLSPKMLMMMIVIMVHRSEIHNELDLSYWVVKNVLAAYGFSEEPIGASLSTCS